MYSSPSGKGNIDPYTKLPYTNLFVSKREGASWSAPQELQGINSDYHDAVGTISPSGNIMVFTRSYTLQSGTLGGNENKVSTTQLYISRKSTDDSWLEAMVMPFCDNKYMYTHPTFSSDGLTLYFSSDMPGGFGGMDLWSVYNVIQEKLVHGMFNYKYGVKVRKARKIKNFKQDIVLNEKLYDLALAYAN